MLLICVILVLILCYVYTRKSYNYWKAKHVKYSKPTFIFGNLASNFFRRKTFQEALHDIYMEFSSDRYFGFYQFLTPILMIKDVDLIKRITVKDFDYFPEHKAFTNEDVDPLWGKNLFASKAKRWRQMRPKLSPSFTGSKMKAMFSLITESAEQFTEYFTTNPDKAICLDIKDALTRYANDVIATTAFGIKCDSLKDRSNEFYLMGKEATNFSGLKLFKFLLNEDMSKFFKIKMFSKAVRTFFRGIISETVRTREEMGIVRNDMIHLLMEARKGTLKDQEDTSHDTGFATAPELIPSTTTNKQKEEITIDDITAQALVFFFAGFDTSATLMSFIIYELAINPDIQERLYKEVKRTSEASDEKVTYEGLMSMKYMDMVVSETLRKWPASVVTDRKSVKPYLLQPKNPNEKPVLLETGSSIFFPIYSIHRDPKYFPNPEKFDPERFSEENKQNIVPFSYIPFGCGPRNCIGSRFALMESKIIIFYILKKFEILTIEKTPMPLIMDPINVNLMPVGGMWVGLKLR